MKHVMKIITKHITHAPITRPLSGRVIACTPLPFTRNYFAQTYRPVPVRAHWRDAHLVPFARNFASQSGHNPKAKDVAATADNKMKQLVSEEKSGGDGLPNDEESADIFEIVADFFQGFLAAIYGDAATIAAVVWKTMEAMAVMLATEHILKRSYRFLKNVVSLYLEKGIAKYELGPGRMLYVFEMPNLIKGTANAWLDMRTNVLHVRGLHPKDGKVKFLTKKIKIIGSATQLKATHFVKLNIVAVDVKDFDSNRKTEMKVDEETGDLESIVGRKVSTEEGEESQETSN